MGNSAKKYHSIHFCFYINVFLFAFVSFIQVRKMVRNTVKAEKSSSFSKPTEEP